MNMKHLALCACHECPYVWMFIADTTTTNTEQITLHTDLPLGRWTKIVLCFSVQSMNEFHSLTQKKMLMFFFLNKNSNNSYKKDNYPWIDYPWGDKISKTVNILLIPCMFFKATLDRFLLL